jgi:hypothetical protein
LPLLLGLLCAGSGCFQDSSPQHTTFLPLDYRTTFQIVRACRSVTGHDLGFQRVLADPANAALYSSGGPLPAGAVVLGEQHGDPSCNSLNGFYLMAKEPSGYDPGSGDWHWQRLDFNQRVVEDGRLAKCATCHAKPPCADFLCSPP